MRNMILFTALALFLFGCCACSTKTVQENGEFAIFLPVNITHIDQMDQADFYTMELKNEPIITVYDIIEYNSGTHEIELTNSSIKEINLLGHGQPFVVCVGQERIYGGAFWNPTSSYIWGGITINLPLDDNTHFIRIDNILFSGGEDPRSDPRISESLEKAGKLKSP